MAPAIVLAAVTAALVTSVLVGPVRTMALAFGAVDRPGGRRRQADTVPRLGGVAILAGISLGFTVALLSSAVARDSVSGFEIAVLGVGCLLIFLLGIADDILGVSPLYKLGVQSLAAWILVQAGWSFEVLSLPFLGAVDLGGFGVVVSLLWIVGVTNAINLIDGLDGLASGVVAIIAVSFLILAGVQGAIFTLVILAATVGACLGFLRHNWSPAKIFLGDSGSLTLGFLLAAESIHASLKAPAAVAIFVPILALGVPVQDTLAVMGVRFMEAPRSSLLQRALRVLRADRNHLHHLLSRFGHQHRHIVLEIYGLVLMSCLFAFLVTMTRNPTLGFFLIALELVVILSVRWLGLQQAGQRLARSKLDELKLDYELGPAAAVAAEIPGRDELAEARQRPALRKVVAKSATDLDGALTEAAASGARIVGLRKLRG